MGRIIGLDVGKRRVGVAISDPTNCIASPLLTITNQGLSDLVAQIYALCQEHQVDMVVVGVPLQADGGISFAAGLALKVVEKLRATKIKVAMWDESYSSKTAKKVIKGSVSERRARVSGVVDRIAASLILGSYLTCRGRQQGASKNNTDELMSAEQL